MQIINRHGLSSVFVIALQRGMAEYRNVGWRSTTNLIDSPRQKILLERHYDEIEVDVADCLPMIEGTSLHDMLSNLGAYEPDVITEKAIILNVAGMPIKMQADRIEPVNGRCGDATKYILKDFKRTKVGSYKRGGRASWTAQGNMYRMGYNALLGIDIVQVQFELILSDWHKAELVRHDYPPHPIMPMDVPLWSYEETMEYTQKRVALFIEQEGLSDDDLVECTPSEKWSEQDYYGVWNKKPGTAKAYKKVVDQAQAIEIQQEMKDPKQYEVRFMPGGPRRCKTCEVREFCRFA